MLGYINIYKCYMLMLYLFLSPKWSEVTQSCPALCDPMDYSPPGSSVLGIFQARVLEWIAISFFRGSSWSRDQTRGSCIAGRHFTVWATGKAPVLILKLIYPVWYEVKSLVAQTVKNLPALQETWPCFIPGSGRSPGEGNGYPLQYSCLENCIDRVANSQTWLSD